MTNVELVEVVDGVAHSKLGVWLAMMMQNGLGRGGWRRRSLLVLELVRWQTGKVKMCTAE